jgi:deoxycytidylate deaminase
VAAGIKRVVYVADYRASITVDYLKTAGVDVDLYQEDKDWDSALVDLFSKPVEIMKPKEGDVKIKEE